MLCFGLASRVGASHKKETGMSSNGMGHAISISGPFPPLGKLGTRKSPGIEIVGCVDQCVSDIIAHLGKFSLNISSSSFVIRVNLLHP